MSQYITDDMFKRSKDVPEKVSSPGLSKWYSSLDDQNKIKLKRYLDDIDPSSRYSFFSSLLDSSLIDENHGFASFVGDAARKEKMTADERFDINEMIIEAYIGSERYDDAVSLCKENLDLYGDTSRTSSGIPDKLVCRNRLIDVLIGVFSEYDEANMMMDRFFDMGIISKEDLEIRKQSLKIHRMQRVFDGIYTYRPKE